MGFATRCICGNMSESFGGLCDRCVALQALELDTSAREGQIEDAYRTLVKVWHPDRFQNDPNLRLAAEEKLKEINAAHEFLLSEAARKEAPPQPKPAEPIQEPHIETPAVVQESALPPEPEKPEAPLGPRRENRSFSGLLFRAGVAAGAFAVIVVLWVALDGALSSNSMTAEAWLQTKGDISRNFEASGLRLWYSATSSPQRQKEERDAAFNTQSQPSQPSFHQQPEPSFPRPQSQQPVMVQYPAPVVVSWVPPAAPAPAVAAISAHVAASPHIRVVDARRTIQPYVTAGLTPLEVLTILGKPTSSAGQKMFYRDSEIDFRNGRVVGWVIDPRMAPIRVKLWPGKVPVPGTTQFAFGSSKSDVIALQGTPSLFSDNKFGYGNSMVYFQNNQVIGWDEDPNSVRLRVAH